MNNNTGVLYNITWENVCVAGIIKWLPAGPKAYYSPTDALKERKHLCPRSLAKVQRCLLIEQAEATHSALRRAVVLEDMISQLFCYSWNTWTHGGSKVSPKQNHGDVTTKIRSSKPRVAKPTDVHYSRNTGWAVNKNSLSSPVLISYQYILYCSHFLAMVSQGSSRIVPALTSNIGNIFYRLPKSSGSFPSFEGSQTLPLCISPADPFPSGMYFAQIHSTPKNSFTTKKRIDTNYWI